MSEVEEEAKEEERKKKPELIDVLPFVSSLYQAEGNSTLGLCKHVWLDANLWFILIEAKHSTKNKDGSTALLATRLVLASRKGRYRCRAKTARFGRKDRGQRTSDLAGHLSLGPVNVVI